MRSHLLRALGLLLFALCVFPSFAHADFRHDIHISYGKAELRNDSLVISISLYKDDFRKALAKWHVGGVESLTSPEYAALEVRYLQAFVRAWADDNQQLQFNSVIRSEEDASLRFTFAFLAPKGMHSLVLDDRILLREYGDQMNLLDLKIFGREMNHIFTSSAMTFYARL
jgi:hypothetical protein